MGSGREFLLGVDFEKSLESVRGSARYADIGDKLAFLKLAMKRLDVATRAMSPFVTLVLH